MARANHVYFNVADRSYLALIKKEIHFIATQVNFSVQQIATIDIIVAEMTSNLVKYARDGQLLVRILDNGEEQGLELISIDQGPGMTDVTRMQEDGISTGTSLGQGLGAIKRLSHQFQVYSVKGWGTILLSRIWTKEPALFRPKPTFEVQSLVVPKNGETSCGDGSFHKVNGNHLLIFAGDALGHGEEAAKVMQQAIASFKNCPEISPVEILRYMHSDLRKSRGLVGSVATFDFVSKTWRLAGVGNISTKMGNFEGAKGFFPYNGIIGMNVPNTMKDQEAPHHPQHHLVFCSDGIRSRWELYKLATIYRYDPVILAAAIYKDFSRNTDDMSVTVGKINLPA